MRTAWLQGQAASAKLPAARLARHNWVIGFVMRRDDRLPAEQWSWRKPGLLVVGDITGG
jgi:hypothetical protein